MDMTPTLDSRPPIGHEDPRFRFAPAENPEQEDDAYELRADPRFSVQVFYDRASTVFIANFLGEEVPGDPGSVYLKPFGEFTSLERAQAVILEKAAQVRPEASA